MDNIDYDFDIIIVGGGLTGALLQIALADSNLKCLLVDSKSLTQLDKDLKISNFDARSLALASSSIRILKTLNIWQHLEESAAVIDKIHVSQKGKFGNTLIESQIDERLGFVIEMHILQNAIYKLLNQQTLMNHATLTNFDTETNIATITKSDKTFTLKTKLLIAADGTNSKVRDFCNLKCNIKNFNEQALVANIGLARPHANIAYERFTENGPLAMLPMTNQRSSLVWSLPQKEALRMQELSEKDFLSALQNAFGYRLGKFIKVGKRVIFPLNQVVMPVTHENSIVFIGNAAHTLHPVAGQGFNLGLRDVATLAECILKYGLSDEMLKKYQLMRNHDQKYIKLFTENLINIFKNKLPILSNFRSLSLLALDNSNLGKNLLEKYARGFAGNAPDLVCGISLYNKDESCTI